MKLAITLGWQSVELMLEGMSYRELRDWMTFYSIEPFPEERKDLRNGSLMSLLVNMFRDTDQHPPTAPKDFITDWWEEGLDVSNKQTPEQLLFMAYMINKSAGGTIVERVQ